MWSALISVVVSTCVSVLVGGITARATERRTAFNARKAAIAQDVESISSKARRYWRTPGKDPSLEAEIVELFDQFLFRLGAFFDHAADPKAKPVFDLMAESLHIAATGGSFQSANHAADNATAEDVRQKAEQFHKMFTDLRLDPRK